MLGLNMIPTTILSRDESVEPMSIQQFVPDAVTGEKADRTRIPDIRDVRMMEH